MSKELFNQTIKNTLAGTDRVAVGVPGMTGANNITASDLLKQTGNWNIMVGAITNAALVAGKWSLAHNKGTYYVRFTLRNPAGYEQNTAGMFHVVDVNNIEVEFGGAIENGSWNYIFEYILL
jgi:hypothetical protein